jgi:hypothetical protein
MSSVILDLVKLNEKIDYTFLIPLVILYFIIFWLIVSIWVYIDTKKRIHRRRYRFLIFLLNIIFGLPFLLLYLLARPYDIEEMEEISGGGVNVPIVNFVGKEGIVMALELRMSPTNMLNKDSMYDANMKIGVSIETPKSQEDKPIKIDATQVKDESKDAIVDTNQNKEKEVAKKGLVNFIKNLFEFKNEDNKLEAMDKDKSMVTKEGNQNNEGNKQAPKKSGKKSKKRNR